MMKHHDLILLGGGHTHVLLIKALAMKPIDGVRVTLVSEQTLTPYSGMLPGFVAGHYSLEQTNIDLNKLCRKAGVRWIKARAEHVDPDLKRIVLADQASLEFDVLSIDIGSTPDQSIKGARAFTTGVKPISGFQQQWSSLLTSSRQKQGDISKPLHWGVIGAGAGGVELVLAMAHRMKARQQLNFHLVYRGASVLPGYPAKVIKRIEQKLHELNVRLHPGFSVCEVNGGGLRSASGDALKLDQSIWCTGAVGAAWLSDSELETTDKNFIKVNEYLQSMSYAHVFAVGDIAEMVDDPRPKAGVFAVRQAPGLEENLRRYFSDRPLKKVSLQSSFLSLLALGDKSAVASRNGFTLHGRWVWRWKNSIDQKFMDQFVNLSMSMTPPTDEQQDDMTMHCAGCGSKLGPDLLMNNLAKIKGAEHAVAEDASLWQPTENHSLVQSIDGFRSFTSDEYRFARICVNHALSDINAMGASATHAQAWINLSFNHPRLQQRDHLRILQAIVDGVQEQGAKLSGGHSSEGAETHLGIVANGEVLPDSQWPKAGAQPGDILLLSKPLGTGVILAADMQGAADANAADAAYETMLSSNYKAAQQLRATKSSAVTDVTGFGLLGHLLEMLDGASSKLGQSLVAELTIANIPVISGAQKLAADGWRSSLYPQLVPYFERCNGAEHITSDQLDLLIDPQTSGGLLASVSPGNAERLLEQGGEFVVIGTVELSTDVAKEQSYINIS
ncbi:MAG: selenide, water dikinase SelD [Gammaproteobacteria bacterium]